MPSDRSVGRRPLAYEAVSAMILMSQRYTQSEANSAVRFGNGLYPCLNAASTDVFAGVCV